MDTGSGPSSKVIATAGFPEFPLLIMGRKKLKRGRKGAIAQRAMNADKGIRERRTSTKAKRIAARNETKQVKWAREKCELVMFRNNLCNEPGRFLIRAGELRKFHFKTCFNYHSLNGINRSIVA